MGLGMNFNSGNNIKQAKATTPKHTFNGLKNKDKVQNKTKITSVKIDTHTLAELTFIQHLLNVPKHEDLLKQLVDNALPKILKNKKINPKEAKFSLKLLMNKH